METEQEMNDQDAAESVEYNDIKDITIDEKPEDIEPSVEEEKATIEELAENAENRSAEESLAAEGEAAVVSEKEESTEEAAEEELTAAVTEKEESTTEEEKATVEDTSEEDNLITEETTGGIEKPEKKRFSFFKKAGIVLVFLAIIYGGISYYFSSHFFYHTKIYGTDCSFKTIDEVMPVIEKHISDYSITLEERNDITETITSDYLGLKLLNDGAIEGCMDDQKCYTWIRSLWTHFVYDDKLSVTYDANKFKKAINMLSAEQEANIIAPEDAYSKYNSKTKVYDIIPEVYGTTIKNDIFVKTLKEAILSQEKTYNLERHKCYENPKIYSDNAKLVQSTEELNKYMKTKITYDFGDRTEVVGPDVVNKWLSIGDNYKVTLSEKKVKAYVKKMAEKYDTVGKTRKFTSIAGNKVKVSGGTYGWKIDQKEEYKKLLSLVKNHEVTDRTPEYEHIAKSRNKFDIGDTYIEVDLSSQHMWFYKNGKTLVSTDVVTGDVSKGRGTPTGVYYIVYKTTDYVLTGQGYANHVDYWMPFIDNRGIGIHDASWRSSFGGGIYYGNGSHGCVNTPHDAVRKIYNNIESTYPVVVHN